MSRYRYIHFVSGYAYGFLINGNILRNAGRKQRQFRHLRGTPRERDLVIKRWIRDPLCLTASGINCCA